MYPTGNKTGAKNSATFMRFVNMRYIHQKAKTGSKYIAIALNAKPMPSTKYDHPFLPFSQSKNASIAKNIYDELGAFALNISPKNTGKTNVNDAVIVDAHLIGLVAFSSAVRFCKICFVMK
jgi:hypothetical protein